MCVRLVVLLLWFNFVASKVVILSGATGVLGTRLSHALLQVPSIVRIYAGYRNFSKVRLLPQHSSLTPFPFDMDDIEVGLNTIENIVQKYSSNEIILINNAAICQIGVDQNNLRHTLHVNTLCPIKISKIVANQIDFFNKRHNDKIRLSIINISSGDGELAYFSTAFREELCRIKSVNELEDYILTLYNRKYEDLVYSSGGTPCYSLSKALLNRFTVLFGNELDHVNNRIVSLCPGNFMSSMTASDEMMDLTDLNSVTADILPVALDWKYKTGLFYRFREIIPY